jgi:hypothetical protein
VADLGAPFLWTKGAAQIPRPSAPFVWTKGAAQTPRPSAPFMWTRGKPAPVRSFSGASSGIVKVGPLRIYSATTGGITVFVGVSPAAFLTASGVSTGVVQLAWQLVGDLQTGLRVERTPNGQGAWIEIGSVSGDTVIFFDMSATPLVVFDYRVIAFNSAEEAQPSNVASAYSPAPSQTPSSSPKPVLPTTLEFLSPGAYGIEKDLDGSTGGNKL